MITITIILFQKINMIMSSIALTQDSRSTFNNTS